MENTEYGCVGFSDLSRRTLLTLVVIRQGGDNDTKGEEGVRDDNGGNRQFLTLPPPPYAQHGHFYTYTTKWKTLLLLRANDIIQSTRNHSSRSQVALPPPHTHTPETEPELHSVT